MTAIVLPQSEPKAPGSADRSVPLERTLALVPELRRRFGITRLGDTTLLDRTGIPTMCAVVPESPDLLSVYNGKGTTREAAIASAVMEAVERQAGAAPTLETHERPVREVCEFLDLDALGLLEEARNLRVACAYGTDLFTGDVVPVPMALIACPYSGPRLFRITSTNGLASGNTLLEAMYHALAEVVERHVRSLFVVRSELVPRYYRGRDAQDAVLAEQLHFPTGNDDLDAMAGRIAAAGLSMRVMILRESTLPTVALATLVEPSSDPPMAHSGFGCSLSSAHAVSRAMTEAVQSRVTDIQGARDDLLRADEPPKGMGEHARRSKVLPHNRWDVDLPAKAVALHECSERAGDDLCADVRTVLEALCDARLGRIVAVNVSPADVAISVVRIVAPGLETTSINSRIGPRGVEFFNPFPKPR